MVANAASPPRETPPRARHDGGWRAGAARDDAGVTATPTPCETAAGDPRRDGRGGGRVDPRPRGHRAPRARAGRGTHRPGSTGTTAIEMPGYSAASAAIAPLRGPHGAVAPVVRSSSSGGECARRRRLVGQIRQRGPDQVRAEIREQQQPGQEEERDDQDGRHDPMNRYEMISLRRTRHSSWRRADARGAPRACPRRPRARCRPAC